MAVLSLTVAVFDADCGSPLVAAELTDAVVPEPTGNLLIRKPTKNESFAIYLEVREGGREEGWEREREGERGRKEEGESGKQTDLQDLLWSLLCSSLTVSQHKRTHTLT